ncbi:Protein of unknown function [Pyronema omphalodes CBS 100304]|uniref:Uncharacterized protein n=1 Tax=Pyronema omphalodes (strain CBS 100304) TaxID=1076935 RepID=U4LIH8_PYROM|nr:Protein of unknown function [Pyronema omphalodes CBS 100304]
MPPVVGVPEGVSKGVTLTIAVFSKEGETPSPHDGFKVDLPKSAEVVKVVEMPMESASSSGSNDTDSTSTSSSSGTSSSSHLLPALLSSTLALSSSLSFLGLAHALLAATFSEFELGSVTCAVSGVGFTKDGLVVSGL